MRVYVGTYTNIGGSLGVYQFNLDQDTGTLEPLGLAVETESPAFLAINSKKTHLYAVNESTHYENTKNGAVSCFEIQVDGQLSGKGIQSSLGGAPCHMSVMKDQKHLGVSNYMGGNIVVYPIQEDGSLGEPSCEIKFQGKGPNEFRQEAAHPHSFNVSPNGRHVYICDLGSDKVWIFNYDGNGKLTPATPASVESAPGAGPRHMTWHPSKPWLYVINELNCTITSYTINDESGELNEINTAPTRPEGFTGDNLCADIHVLECGRFLYGSNRGDNSIVVCSIDQQNGELKVIQHHPCGGDHPRNIAITPNNKFLLVANETDNNIVTLKIDGSTGKLSFTGIEAKISMPSCVKFLS
ncbi:MAG: lactonase family protein [Gammaproteobacteria bacterium]|nr:lactonase family protein [Gammaproteobacteria bacterium]